MPISRCVAIFACLFAALGVAPAAAQTIDVTLGSMNATTKGCSFDLALENNGGPAVHEYRIMFFIVAGGQDAKLCEQRLGHPKPKYHERCNNEKQLSCDAVQGLTILDLQCLDPKGKEILCRDLMRADDTMLSIDLVDPPFAIEKD